ARAGRGVRLAAVHDHGSAASRGDRRAREVHGRGRDAVRREETGDGRPGLADEQAEVGAAGQLEPRAHAGRRDAEWERGAHGYTAVDGSAVVSSRPRIRFRFWIA